jgi:hypothetical protein
MKRSAKLVHVGIPRRIWRVFKIEAARKDRRLYEVLCERLGFDVRGKPKMGNPDRAVGNGVTR